MKAIVYKKYGVPTEVMKLEEVEKPIPKADEVLIKVKAISLNASDVEFVQGTPIYTRFWGFSKPKYTILGSDVAGIVATVGEQVTQFKVGDAVFGDIMYTWGGFAEYICVKANLVILKPANCTFQAAAALPQAGVVALQGLRDKGQLEAGQKVLINGAGGGSGTFAIQLAKHYGAEVTGIDNTGKLELMRSVGADHVMDYTQEDFVQIGRKYDLIIDFVAHRSLLDYQKVLAPKGQYILVGGLLKRLFQTLLLGPIIGKWHGQQLGMLAHEYKRKDLATLLELLELGKLKPIIDNRIFRLEEVPQALSYLRSGQAKGKVIIEINV